MYVCVCTCVCMYVCMRVHVCVYVCMYACVCVHVCVYVCMYACVCVHVCMCVCMYVCVCVHVYVYVCMYVYVCVCTCVCMYVCMYACVYVCMYVYMRVFVCVHVCVYVCMDCWLRQLDMWHVTITASMYMYRCYLEKECLWLGFLKIHLLMLCVCVWILNLCFWLLIEAIRHVSCDQYCQYVHVQMLSWEECRPHALSNHAVPRANAMYARAYLYLICFLCKKLTLE